MKSFPLAWQGKGTQADLPQIAREITSRVQSKDPFCLWLVGDLGAGKTTLTGEILRSLGLPKGSRVTSPTFTYMNDYQAGGLWYAHLDLYRGNASMTPEELGLVDARNFRGYFVEWPESIPASPVLAPTHVLEITFVDGGAARRYALSSKP